MNTAQIRGRGLSISSRLDFSPLLPTLNCFPSFVLWPVPFFLNLPFFFYFFLTLLAPTPAAHQTCGAVPVDRLSSVRSGGQGQHLQIVGQKAEAAQPSAGALQELRVHAESRGGMTLNRERKHAVLGLEGLHARLVRLTAYGVFLQMD